MFGEGKYELPSEYEPEFILPGERYESEGDGVPWLASLVDRFFSCWMCDATCCLVRSRPALWRYLTMNSLRDGRSGG